MKLRKRLNTVLIIESCFLLLAVILTLVNVNNWLSVYFDSDMGSMLVQDKLLSDEGSIVSPNWYYSTEIMIISHNLIYPWIFKFFDNWHLVRMIGVVIMYLLFASSFMYLLKNLNVKHIPLFTILLFVPLNDSYFVFVLAGCEYINLMTLTFISFALVLSIGKSKFNYGSWIKLVIFLILSFLTGLQGMRQVGIFYFPLFISSIIICFMNSFKNKKVISVKSFISDRLNLVTFFALLSSFIGFIFNVELLHKYYSFATTSYSSSINITKFSFDRCNDFINFFLMQFGFSYDKPITSLRCIASNMICVFLIVVTVIAIIKILKNWRREDTSHIFLVIFYFVGLFVFLFLICFTDFPVTNRNFMSHSILYVCIISVLFCSYHIDTLTNKRLWCTWFTICLIFVSYFGIYKNANCLDYRKESEILEMPTVSKIISDNEINWGYTSTLYGSVISEFTNGKVEIWNYGLTNGGLRTDKLSRWFQEKSHFEYRPNTKLFVLLTREQDNNTKFIDRSKLITIYDSQNFVMYSFQNVDELESNLIQSLDTVDLNNYIKD